MRIVLRKLKTLVKMIMFKFVSLFFQLRYKVNEKKVFFVSDVRNELGGNLKDVYDYLEGKGYDRQVFCKRKRTDKTTKADFVEIAKQLSTAKYILLEDVFDYIGFMHVRKGQEICQLWHGAGAYKRFGFSRLKNEKGNLRIHKGYRKYAKAITSADSIRECYAEAFDIDIGKVRATGIPRTDIFFDKAYIGRKKTELYNEFPQFRGKKVILFAPTYRGTKVRDAAYNFDMINLKEIYQQLGDEYVFVFKWHPAAYNNILLQGKDVYNLEGFNDFYMDLSQNRDINDLLLITDVLITDYSSVIFDYLLVDKPIVYYTYDLEEYSADRGIYYPFEDYVYGAVVRTQAGLIQAIKNEDMMEDKRETFRKRFMEACDGHSTEHVCKWIFDM
ncbi:CDP-glycerol glycerophosphotransferase family protein [Anaerovorax odorimutans]|uniref:CDP-glycerol glycerophosphotransferase family protein n=1 Tax=Anaerovorax odorimutans TaxID=109327 RepID=A0ABT1RJB8_9FIRM|nr:CDP-glycerol glycerophosphotransferase family protein [Anaerovorax odorimutans]MCQ4635274.1 CDP-glycerol glycerophosphotransferase family protein [Anaerovorax odorimutans]